MINLGFLVLSVTVFFGVVGISVEVNRTREKVNGTHYFLYTCVCLMLWAGCTVFYIAEPIPDITIRWFKLKFIGELFYPLFYLLFLISFSKKEFELKKVWAVFLYAIPIILLFLLFSHLLVGSSHTLIQVSRVLPYKELNVDFGILSAFFWVYVFLLEFIGFAVLLVKFLSVSAIYKSRFFLLIFGSVVSTAFLVFGVLSKHKIIDLYLLGCSLKTGIAYWSLVKYNASDFMILAKDTVFEKISCIAFVLDMNRKILDSNPRAKDLFASADIELDNMYYKTVMERWLKAKNGKMTKNSEGDLMYFKLGGKKVYYQIIESEILDRKSRSVGTFIEMRDVTRQQELIIELFRLVNQDQLTGLYNRRYFEHMFVSLDKSSQYPLGIISGDLNKLKQTNDTYGHIIGDRLIALMGELLKRSVPRTAVVARYGGDEFFILVPRTCDLDMREILDTIRENAAAIYEEPFGSISISLGYAIKEFVDEDLNRVKSLADMRMYEDKQKYHKLLNESALHKMVETTTLAPTN